MRALLRLLLNGNAQSYLAWPPTASLTTGSLTNGRPLTTGPLTSGRGTAATDSLRLAVHGRAAALRHVRVLHDESTGHYCQYSHTLLLYLYSTTSKYKLLLLTTRFSHYSLLTTRDGSAGRADAKLGLLLPCSAP